MPIQTVTVYDRHAEWMAVVHNKRVTHIAQLGEGFDEAAVPSTSPCLILQTALLRFLQPTATTTWVSACRACPPYACPMAW